MRHLEPSAFEWWSGVWIPVVSGGVTLIVAAASLVIALVALRVARETMHDGRRIHRMKRAAQLSALSTATANDIWSGNFDDAWARARDVGAELSLAKDHQPASIATQVIYWAMYAMQHRPAQKLREDIAAEILFEVDSAIAAYAADDRGVWKLTRRTIFDLLPEPPESQGSASE